LNNALLPTLGEPMSATRGNLTFRTVVECSPWQEEDDTCWIAPFEARRLRAGDAANIFYAVGRGEGATASATMAFRNWIDELEEPGVTKRPEWRIPRTKVSRIRGPPQSWEYRSRTVRLALSNECTKPTNCHCTAIGPAIGLSDASQISPAKPA
jgi:hypothetical protein